MTRASDTARLLGAGATILDGATISTADNDPQLILKCTDTDASTGPKLDLERNPGEAGADGDNLAQINFYGYNDASEKSQYLYLFAEAADVANGSEDVRFGFGGLVAGADSSLMTFKHGTSATGADPEMVFNDSSKDINFRVESDNDANAFFVEGSTGNIGIGTSSPLAMAKLDILGSAGAQTGANQAFHIKAPTTTAGQGVGIRLSAASGSNEAVGIIGVVNNASGNAGSMTFHTYNGGADVPEHMRLENDGNFLVGKTSNSHSDAGVGVRSDGQTNIVVSGAAPLIINRLTDDGALVVLRQDNTQEGVISSSGSTVSYGGFSGSHWSRLSDNSKPTILKGTVIETIDEMCDWYQAEITIPKTDDKDEYKIKESIALPSGKKVGDTISHTYEGVTYDNAIIIKENDIKHTKCKISDTADSKKVYGVHASWDNNDDTVNDMNVIALGTYVVRINKDVTVSAGDLLSSNGDGTAKVQDDDIIRSKTIGKVLTNIKQETYDDGSYTVPCALYCG